MWAQQAIKHIDFNDKRLSNRLEKMLENFTENPSGSIPEASMSLAQTKAAYRFFSNENASVEEIREGFCKATIERMKELPKSAVVLFPSDSTNIVFTKRKMQGIGVLRNQNAQGLNLHTTIATTDNQLVLGVVHQVCWGREPEEYGKRSQRAKKPIEEKESYRWIEGLQAAQEALPDHLQGIFLGDRGADIFEVFMEPRKQNMNLLIRASHDRVLQNDSCKIFEKLENAESLGSINVAISRSGTREERVAVLDIKAVSVLVDPPKHKKNLSPVLLNFVYAKEICNSDEVQQDLINWKLVTTLSIDTLEQAGYVVTTYAKRWIIERYHYTLKEGCRVEELQFEEASRIDKAIAVYTIVACRLMYLAYLARSTPDAPCTVVLANNEWKALYCLVHKTATPPDTPFTIHEAIRMIAKLGGFLGRKRDGEPGVKVIWRGLRALESASVMYSILRKDVGND
jgi:hypothetical protein